MDSDGDEGIRSVKPTEDSMGRRIPSAAAQALNDNFGGLILGFSGTDPEMLPNALSYRSLLFNPGTNLGPEYPNDIRMTSGCGPQQQPDNTNPYVEGEQKLPPVAAFFYPPMASEKKVRKSFATPSTTPRERPPCDWLLECGGEDHIYDLPNKMFLMFGQNEPMPDAFCLPVFDSTEEAVFDYFEAHSIEPLMEHFITLVCINLPFDPFDYISQLCKKMINYRANKDESEYLETIFEPSHILALFSLFDKQERKFITAEQYKIAMELLGVTRYNPNPIGLAQNIITEDVFFEETTSALETLMKSFIG